MPAELGAAALQERIRGFVDDYVRPVAASLARGDGPRPKDVVGAAGEAGLAGILTSPDLGGAGGSHRDFADLIEAVARADASASVTLDVHVSVGSEPIIIFGDAEQKARYLPRLASGEWLAGFALTEPSAGSDAAHLQTRAVRDGDDYVLRGTKTFITNAGDADLYVVMARTGEGARGISAFIVESGWPGVHAGQPFHKLGLRGSLTAEVVLDDVRVPAANVLGRVGDGFTIAMVALDSGRVGISAQAVGIAQGALDAAVTHARSHAEREADETALADMEARTQASRALTRHAAATADESETVTLAASVAKLYATDTCMAVAQAAMDMCSPESAVETHPAAIRMRDAKACQIYEGTNQVQRIVIARALLHGR